jgi:hypothetical protein
MKTEWLFTVLLACALPAAADPVYKCKEGGKVAYGDRPCATGPSTVLPPPALGVDIDGRNAASTRDARQLLQIEKMRIAREQDMARLRAQRDKEAEREQRAHQRARLAAAKSARQCERLRLRARWADEDAAKARGRAREAALLKARRQAETLAVECPA